MADNAVTIAGNVTRLPELKFTNGGRAVCSFGVACSRRYQVNGEWQEQTSFFNVVAWGTLAENSAQTLEKGTRVVVFGRMEQREYEARDGGGKRQVVEIVADEIGPSLRWATAQVERVARETSTPGGGGNYTARASGNRSGGNQGGNTDSYGYGDDEPF